MLAWKISPAAIRRRQSATASRWCGGGGGVERAAARGRGAAPAGAAADRGQSAARCQALVAAAGARAVGGQRLEPPPPVRVEPQDVVVVGEVELGQRHRARRARRARARRARRAGSRASRTSRRRPRRGCGRSRRRASTVRQPVERRERVARRRRPATTQRFGADDRAAAGPAADQRERQPLVGASASSTCAGRQPAVERHAQQARPATAVAAKVRMTGTPQIMYELVR